MSRVGPYEILAPIGAGGMGEVLRARDPKLGREVAIKVLPAAFAQDAERVARFRREAQILAALNHPSIAAIYGLEESEGTLALVMELVEGEDLGARLKRGAIPVDEALAIAKQIAEALEEAHERGIVHRDLKPANVKVTADGKVKVLDFGLAKAFSADPMTGSGSHDLSQSPTLAGAGTMAGVILGTAAYMSPEQARGKAVDRRADIWAFGVVLYEMLTGRRLFAGETVSDVLAAVLTRNPDWQALPAAAPAGLRALLGRCLERDPRRRLQHMGDARVALEDLIANAGSASGVASEPTTRPRRTLAWLPLALAGLAGLGLGVGLVRRDPAAGMAGAPGGPVRMEVPLAAGIRFLGDLALSPDGRVLVFTGQAADGSRSLWQRSLDSLAIQPIAGTADARFPFWSPDGRRLGFFAGGELRVLDFVSGAVRSVTPTGPYSDVRGGAWGADDTIVFAPTYAGGLLRVSAAGGPAQPATQLDTARGHGTHRVPRFLPDGRHFFFYASAGTGVEPGQLCLGTLGSTEHRCLAESDSEAVALAADVVLFVRGRALLAQEFDAEGLQLRGEPVAVGIEMPSNLGTSGHRGLAAGAGHLAYHTGSTSSVRVAWFGRDGSEGTSVYDKGYWLFGPRLDPTGRRVALSVYRPGSQGEIWLVDPERNTELRLTQRDDTSMALWSRSGRELALMNQSPQRNAVYRVEADRPETLELWRAVPGLVSVDSWLPADRGLLFTSIGATTRADIWRLDRAPDALPQPVLATSAAEHSAELSPDGRWLAYVSDETGREEIYVRRLDGAGSPWKVSSGGANDPRWRADGRELFFVAPGGRLHAVATTLGETFSAAPPQLLFTQRLDESGNRQYDVSPDGRRFVINVQKATEETPIVLVLGWADEIRQRLKAAGGLR
ncbi:MAG: protein kinase [Vicinamibacteria bacterium]|nr:protein kinase [Vicinamibacteria bacterium]